MNSDYKSIKIRILTNEEIRLQSYGAITSESIINKENDKYDLDGLFSEKIFGPTIDGSCWCGKYLNKLNPTKKCEVCGVDLTYSSERSSRIGHIDLMIPILNPWFFQDYLNILSRKIFKLLSSRLIMTKKYSIRTIKTQIKPTLGFKSILMLRVDENKITEIKTIKFTKKDIQEIKTNTESEIPEEGDKIDKILQKKSKSKKISFDKKVNNELRKASENYSNITNLFFIIGTNVLTINKSTIENADSIDKNEQQELIYEVNKISITALLNLDINLNNNKFIWLTAIPVISPNLRPLEVKSNTEKSHYTFTNLPETISKDENSNIIDENEENEDDDFGQVIQSGINDESKISMTRGNTSVKFYLDDINKFYRGIIRFNNMLKKSIDSINDLRGIQQNLWDLFGLINNIEDEVVQKESEVKSNLFKRISGKKGRFRNNLLGKRVDYSGRAVIVGDPKLRINQCGLPFNLAVRIFEPFIVKELINNGIFDVTDTTQKCKYDHANLKNYGFLKNWNNDLKFKTESAINFIYNSICNNDESSFMIINKILNCIVDDKLVLLNRQPTLHRLGIQAFEPVLTYGDAIKLHPLNCSAFGADFDGDTMAVHLPISKESQKEVKFLIQNKYNLLSPRNGEPIACPSQDIILGCYYLTMVIGKLKKEPKQFHLYHEAIAAYNSRIISLNEIIQIGIKKDLLETTIGRIIFNQILPDKIPFQNIAIGKNELVYLLTQINIQCEKKDVLKFLDDVKDLGFKYSTQSGLTIGLDHLIEISQIKNIIAKSEKQIGKLIISKFPPDVIFEKIISLRLNTTNEIKSTVIKHLESDVSDVRSVSQKGLNPLNIMIKSKARGSEEQINQIIGVRGLFLTSARNKKISSRPIWTNLKKGMSCHEYFLSAKASRQSLYNKSKGTADTGYFARKLIYALQDVIIVENDCFTNEYQIIRIPDIDIKQIVGRTCSETVTKGKVLIIKKGDLITLDHIDKLLKFSINIIKIRSILNCKSIDGICSKCYGVDITTNELANGGLPVGIISAQSISEPATQLNLKTFHTGGFINNINDDFTAVFKELSKCFQGKMILDGDVNGKLLLIIDTIQNYFKSCNITINNKHIEVAIREMSSYVRIVKSKHKTIRPQNIYKYSLLRSIINSIDGDSDELRSIIFERMLYGISKLGHMKSNFMVKASYDHTKRILKKSAMSEKKERFDGIALYNMLGLRIPAGTNVEKFNKLLEKRMITDLGK